jgi:23S rRNA (cytosine1962-C5)-methyltransferase
VTLARLALAKGLGRHIRAGHPWVFRRALDRPPKLPAGSVVDLTEDGRFVARGYYDPHSHIAVRVLTLDFKESIDVAFFRRRIKSALALRESMLDLRETDSFRLVHGEGDGLPGVVVDLYAGFAVVKLYSAGLTPLRQLLVEALGSTIPNLQGVIGRDEIGGEEQEGASSGSRTLWGQAAPERILIRERGVAFWVDAHRGQKTGFFLDQRENRALIRGLAKGSEVLNCFAYSGGFSVNAALGGATSVLSVDSDREAIDLARENFRANGLDPRHHQFLAADAFDALAAMRKEDRAFDLIILDPPAFAKTQRAVEGAIAGYASLNRQALAVLRPGGLLATASCSARVSPEAFIGAIREAAFNSGVELMLLEERYQPPDHPIRLHFPEGRYLKFFVLRRV